MEIHQNNCCVQKCTHGFENTSAVRVSIVSTRQRIWRSEFKKIEYILFLLRNWGTSFQEAAPGDWCFNLFHVESVFPKQH